jgi:hypothetical protein
MLQLLPLLPLPLLLPFWLSSRRDLLLLLQLLLPLLLPLLFWLSFRSAAEESASPTTITIPQPNPPT